MQALHFPNYTGTGWQIGSDSTANGMYIYNENGTYAMKLTNAGNATFQGSVTAASASIPTMSVNTNFVGSIYQVGSLFKTNNYINIAGGKYVKKYLLSAYFTNGDANQAVNIYFPNVAMQGYLRITLSGSYSHQNITGKLTKVIPFGWNPNNSIWGPGSNYTIETAVGGVADNFTIGNIAWRSASSQYYIPVYKLSTLGNSVKVIVEYFGDGGSQIDNLALGGTYAISPPAPFNNRHYPSVERLQIGSGGYTGGVQYGIRLPQGTTDDSKIGWADNAGSERAAIICDSSTDSLHFYTGNSGTLSDRVRITAGGVLDVGGDAVFGGGIYLGGTATANKLDDYEEGTWTPTLKFSSGQVGITYAGAAGTVYRNGHYTKIGRVVTFSFRIILTSKGTSVGDATISGLPYDANGGLGNYGSAMYSFANNFLIPLRPTITIDSSSSVIRLRFVNSPNGNYGNVTNSDFNNNSDIILTGTYQST